ncbi:GroES-like protein [Teratosphaeria destructans]|uniref:GroES-like protein n=1 Tax=Teratosphaeria destructans TaxID=418781 RepID=A0A9W7T051_9PEZI|nr:GroES-like protein [Teratosphaeria destructans]
MGSIALLHPETQCALKVQGPGSVVMAEGSPVPHPGHDELLVRVICVGINPFDWKSLDMSPSPGSTWGCDFSGEIIQLGDDVSSQRFHIGDRVAGISTGNNPENPMTGSFAEYAVVPHYMALHIPPEMTYEEAATLPCGLITVGMTLYHNLRLPLPYENGHAEHYVLVYGGGTATGGLAIQALRRSGLVPITTCSPRNFERVKALGAAEAFDYHNPSCAGDIRALTRDTLEYALDCITDSASMKICYGAIGSAGGRYVGLDAFPIRAHTRREVRPDWILAWTVMGKPITWKKPYRRDAKPKDKRFGLQWAPIAQRWLDSGDVKVHPFEVSTEGLAGVAGGADRVRKGTAGGKKLVYRVVAE